VTGLTAGAACGVRGEGGNRDDSHCLHGPRRPNQPSTFDVAPKETPVSGENKSIG
jgi:hypothetical protein